VDRAQEARVPRVVVQGRADLADYRGQGRARDGRARPEAVVDRLLRHHVGPVAEQQLQELEGLGAEVALLLSPPELTGAGVEDKVAEPQVHLRLR